MQFNNSPMSDNPTTRGSYYALYKRLLKIALLAFGNIARMGF